MKIAIFWDVMPWSPQKFSVSKECNAFIFIDGTEPRFSLLAGDLQGYSSSLETETVHFPKMAISFYKTTQHHNSDDNTLHSHRCDVLKFRFIDVAARGCLAAQNAMVVHM
jgi:hypothetical protein